MGIPTSKIEALDLLRKWKQEKKHIFYFIEAAPDHDIAKAMGIVETVADDAVSILADRPADLPQDLFVLNIPLAHAEYEYLESREYLEESEMRELRELRLDPATECALIITIRPMRLRFALAVLSPL